MLFVIHKGHDDFNGGQDRILHLISDVDTVRLTNDNCFFTDIHADLDYAEQIDDFSRLNELNIQRIINEKYWSDFKEEKQAEFLAFESVQWQTIKKIAVKTQAMADEVRHLLEFVAHKPEVLVQPNWYY